MYQTFIMYLEPGLATLLWRNHFSIGVMYRVIRFSSQKYKRPRQTLISDEQEIVHSYVCIPCNIWHPVFYLTAPNYISHCIIQHSSWVHCWVRPKRYSDQYNIQINIIMLLLTWYCLSQVNWKTQPYHQFMMFSEFVQSLCICTIKPKAFLILTAELYYCVRYIMF